MQAIILKDPVLYTFLFPSSSTLLAVAYPALLLSSFSLFNPQDKMNIGNQGAFFRKACVFQFVISVLPSSALRSSARK
jgi:hypothetical protein